MRYLITGGSGQLGTDIKRELVKNGESDILTPSHNELDITDIDQTYKFIKEVSPDVIFHCAAYTNVDKASIERINAWKTNVTGTCNIVLASSSTNSKLINISTDYVFDGKKGTPYEINDERNPINFYGRTKKVAEDTLIGNKKTFNVRTSWVFGENGKNFVKTMLKLAENQDKVDVIYDQVGSPTYTKDLADALIELSKTDAYGTYHMTNEGFLSWYDFCKLIYKEAGVNTYVNPIKACMYEGSNVLRPENSRLSKKCLDDIGLDRLPSVEEAVKNYVKILKK